jgi:hypothetical protein
MCRQIGLALGVSCLVAVLATSTGAAALHAFRHAWIFMVVCGLASGLILQGIPRQVRARPKLLAVPAEQPETYRLAAGE